LGLQTPVLADEVGYRSLSDNLITNSSLETGTDGWELLEHTRRIETDSSHGKYCIEGDGRGVEDTFIGAKLTVFLETGCVYRLTTWLRTDANCYSTIRLEYEGNIINDIVGVGGIPDKWVQRKFVFYVDLTGQYKIVFQMPNTRRQSDGRVWLDNVSLHKVGITKSLVDIGSGLFDDYPCAKGDGQGNIWMACLAFDDANKNEKIVYRKYDGQKWSAPEKTAAAKQMFAPALAVNHDTQWVAWSQRQRDNWDVYVRQIGPKLGYTIKVTTSPATDKNVSAAITPSGDLWVAWQTNRNNTSDIYAAVVNKSNIDPIRISTYDGSDYNPSILAIENDVYIAWDSCRNGNYDIFMKKIHQGAPGKLLQITNSPDTDKYPQLSSDEKDRIWIAYNNSTIGGNQFGRRYNKSYEIRCYHNGRLYQPTTTKSNVWNTEKDGEEFPALSVSEKFGSRLVTAATQNNLLCWMLADRQLQNNKWTKPVMIASTAFTTCRRPAIVQMPDGNAWLIWVSTDRVRNFKRNTNELCNSTITALKLDKLPKNQRTIPLLDKIALKKPAIPQIAPTERQTIQYNNQTLNVYYGDLHCHSNLSMCGFFVDSLPEDQYAFTRDNAYNDFLAVTDHGMHINDYDFHVIKKLANANNQPHEFVAFMAQEYSSCRYYHEGFGHKNIIYLNDNPKKYFNPLKISVFNKPYACPNPAEMWAALRGKKAITIPHQLADSGVGAFTDWSYMDKEMQPVAEIFQARGNYEYKNAPQQARLFKEGHSLQDAWAMGHIIGVIASPDHGGGSGRAVILAKDLTRKSLFEALKKRRCYGTTMAHILLDFRINGHIMGEEITVDKPATPRSIKVISEFQDLQRLVLYRNNQEILHKPITNGRIELEFTDTDPLIADKTTWYYVRVEAKPSQYGEPELAWSSPIWISLK
jgi:hypothetical protein